MKILNTFEVKIWCGLRPGYTNTPAFPIEKVRELCDNYIKKNPNCVTITPTEYRYVDGSEPGVIVGMINYPRFPKEQTDIVSEALALAEILRKELHQLRVSVQTPEFTYMLEDDE